MTYAGLRSLVPPWLRRQVFHFETLILEHVTAFAAQLPPQARLLDAGAGEGQYKKFFPRQQYLGLDLAIGDTSWNYSSLDTLGDLLRLPFRDASFDAFLSVVTLEHVTDPAAALLELARTARPGARLLLVAPAEWELHQHPHDYFRFTHYALQHLLSRSGWRIDSLLPGGGFFRLLSRRLMNSLQFFPPWLIPLLAIPVVPAALLIAQLDFLDSRRDFTLGYIVYARKI
ncbi:MAG: class I SAM-dependent methyltransferase [Acidobacteriota bacterium]